MVLSELNHLMLLWVILVGPMMYYRVYSQETKIVSYVAPGS